MIIVRETDTAPLTETRANYFDSLTPFKINKSELYAPPSREYAPLLKFQLPESVNFQQLVDDTHEALLTFGQWNYRLLGEGHMDMSYGGMGLTYNPDHIDGNSGDVHQQVQGNHNPGTIGVSNPYSTYSNENMPSVKRNTHYDTFGFATRTPASRFKSLGTFLDSFKCTMVRTAIRIIYAEQEGPVGDDKYAGVTWHKDEPMTTNLRINIPLVTHPDYVLEQEGYNPLHLEAGHAYSWDTNTLHRAYARTRTAPPRIHLMLGISPWWHYNENFKVWNTNKFAGVKHPLDMLVDGDIIEGIKLISS
jgi:hypothetical protein